jgi:hypothetical protein
MKFEIGQKIKIESSEGTFPKKSKTIKIGEIVSVTKRVIVLQFKNYKESLSVADFQKYNIFIRANKKWIQLKIK